MKRKAFVAFLILIIGFTYIFADITYGYSDIVRVGLTSFENVGSVSVGGQTVMTGYSSGNRFYEIQYLDLSGGAQVSKQNSHYIAVGGSFTSYEAAKAYANSLSGYNVIPAFKGNGIWNAYIGPYESKERAEAAKANYPYESVVCAPSATTLYLSSASDRMVYDYSGGYFAITGDSVTNIGGSSYRGYIEFYSSGGSFTAVNVISVETYLCGVVPSEMPSGWGLEALKAQAVAARTYVANRLESGGGTGNGYDICDTAHCQMYTGTASEAASSTEAVRATAGQVAAYNGQLINAVYCSSAGGVTDDNLNVWGTDTPYLKSVEEIEGAEVVEWNVTYTFSQLMNMLSARGVNIGKLVYVSVERSENGRVYSMTFSGEKGTYKLEKEDVRTFLSSEDGSSLKSRVFDISFDYNDVTDEFSLIINGKGWGHGLGLSQFGAKSMAEAGYTYDEILKHYYTGVEIVNY